ncbi:MAG: response regulator, partial [Gammaproteobacteria bacterium]
MPAWIAPAAQFEALSVSLEGELQLSFHAAHGASWRSPGYEKTVLVTDDDRTVRTVIARMLRADGYRVVEAEQGEKCLLVSMEKHIDAFLVDLHLPGFDGVELCKRIRAIDRYRFTPIICITVVDEELAVGRAFEAGADDFITKPVNPRTLRARLGGRIQKTEYLRETERVRANFSRYISRRAQAMIEAYSATGLLPTPETQDVCVLFSDVRGYTQQSQILEPNRLFDLLSTHLGMQVDCVHRYGGSIDKFAGDGIMAIFDSDDRTRAACQCALEIMEITRSKAHGDARVIQLGVGIHRGRALIGNIGSDSHLAYSVIGETVNLAARLCGWAEPMSIVVSEEVRRTAAGHSGFVFVAPCQVAIRGLKYP